MTAVTAPLVQNEVTFFHQTLCSLGLTSPFKMNKSEGIKDRDQFNLTWWV